jgi:exosortase A-associated hydrolase 2
MGKKREERMNVGGGKIEPFYFGSSAKPLFGLYHAPRPDSIKQCAMVMCSPMGHEYIQFHRALRLLGDQMCRAGFPVLRFDFYGCGDSGGQSEEGQINQWLSDVSTAVAEARRRSGVFKICLVGLRLGASLAAMVGAERGDIDGLVLWDPIINGKTYLDELKTLHRQMLRTAHVVVKHDRLDENVTEVLGFPLTSHLMAELENIDLLMIKRKPAANVLILRSHPQAGMEGLRDHLKTMGAEVEYRHLPSPQLWKWIEDFGKILVPHQTLQSVVAWVSEVYS